MAEMLFESAEILNRYADRFPLPRVWNRRRQIMMAMPLKEDSVDDELAGDNGKYILG